ncbi:MAG: hypothetical protein ACR5LD_03110 [Symbiopectobacterium sp.]
MTQLSEQSGATFADGQEVTEHLQQLLEREREITVERDEVAARKRHIDDQIERLSQPGGAEDPRMAALVERFGSVLLSEIYDDVTRSTMRRTTPRSTGISRHGIVVDDLSLVREQL